MQYTITEPIVDDQAATGYRYDGITFAPGDRIRVEAGGCVQTGGIGETSKWISNGGPHNNDNLYFAKISIPNGAYARSEALDGGSFYVNGIPLFLVSDSPAEIVVPEDATPVPLILSYIDEADHYGDNGYYNLAGC